MITLNLANNDDLSRWSERDLSDTAAAEVPTFIDNGYIDGRTTYKHIRLRSLALREIQRRNDL